MTVIMVVEDEGLIAKDIQLTLERLGYRVPPPIARAEIAIETAKRIHPDLILMDIRLQGEMDGIAAAEEIRRTMRVPVVFLTAHSDDATLARAKKATPYGYLVKPFEDTDVRTTIEIALHKHKIDVAIAHHEALMRALLRGLSDAVVGLDARGNITFMNEAARAFAHGDPDRAVGKKLDLTFHLGYQDAPKAVSEAILKAVEEGVARKVVAPALAYRSGQTTVPIDGTLTPLRTDREAIEGSVLIFRDISAHALIELLMAERDVLQKRLEARMRELL